MAALGYQHIPAVLQRAYVVDVDMAAFWPQVVSGLWTMNEVIAYLDYLFDFDSRGWARSQGLLFNEPRAITLDPKQQGTLTRA